MPIEGKIAKILDEYRVIINRGAADGVKAGMCFVIFSEVDEVSDPETGRSLGRWEMVKGRLAAGHVQEHMAVCSPEEPPANPQEKRDPSTNVLSAQMIAVSMQGPGGAAGAKLNVDHSAVSGLPVAKPVTVGDRVRSVEP